MSATTTSVQSVNLSSEQNPSKRRSPRRPHSHLTMGVREVAVEVLGVESAQAVYRLLKKDVDFPQSFRPYGTAKGTRRWFRKDVEAWVRRMAREAQRKTA